MSKILLVEDDESIYTMYQKVFVLEGFEIELAADGQEALDKLATFQPAMIILDVMMPRMNGIEVLAKLKINPATKDIPVIMLTNLSDIDTANRAISLGAKQFAVKSATEPKQLVELVKSLLAQNSAN